MPYTSGANDLTEGPFLGGYMLITEPNASLTLSGRACALPLGGDGVPAEERRRAYYYTIFPNLMLSIHPDYVVSYLLWPQAPGRTHIECEWLFRADALGRPDFNPDDAVQFWDLTNRQDWHICEQSFAGISSRAYGPGPSPGDESHATQGLRRGGEIQGGGHFPPPQDHPFGSHGAQRRPTAHGGGALREAEQVHSHRAGVQVPEDLRLQSVEIPDVI